MENNSNLRLKLLKYLDLNSINHFFLISLSVFLTMANLTHGFIGSYSRYVADDYCTAGKLTSLGFWNAQTFWYNNWTGRYSFTFFVSMFELFDPLITSVLPYIFIILLYLSIYIFFIQIFKRLLAEKYRLFSLFSTSLVVFVILFSVPNIQQSLYWMTGSTTYFLPLIIFFLFLSLLINQGNRHKKNNLNYVIMNFFVFLLAFILSGFSEVFSVLQIFIFGFAYIFMIAKNKKLVLNNTLFFALWGSIIGLFVLVLAPGNSVRLSQYQADLNIFGLIFKTFVSSSQFIILWLVKHINIIWPTCTMIIVFSSILDIRIVVTDYLKKNKFTLSGLLIISGLILVYASYLPSIWATGYPPADRALIFPVVILTFLCFSTSFIIGVILKDFLIVNQIKKNNFFEVIIIISILYFHLGVPINQARLNYAFRVEASTYATRWEEREIIIQEQLNSGESALVVPMIPENIIDIEPIQTNPDHWINKCASEYYGVDQISAE